MVALYHLFQNSKFHLCPVRELACCTRVWNRSQINNLFDRNALFQTRWNGSCFWLLRCSIMFDWVRLCSIVELFDYRTFDCVRLAKFFVSSIKFDYRTQSKGIKRIGSIGFDYETFDWLRRVYLIPHMPTSFPGPFPWPGYITKETKWHPLYCCHGKTLVYEEGRNNYFVGTGINAAWAPGRCIMGREKSVYKGKCSTW